VVACVRCATEPVQRDARLKQQRLVMRHVHRAGEKVFTDHAGKRSHIVDRVTGEAIAVEIFVAVLRASNLMYGPGSRVTLPPRLRTFSHEPSRRAPRSAGRRHKGPFCRIGWRARRQRWCDRRGQSQVSEDAADHVGVVDRPGSARARAARASWHPFLRAQSG